MLDMVENPSFSGSLEDAVKIQKSLVDGHIRMWWIIDKDKEEWFQVGLTKEAARELALTLLKAVEEEKEMKRSGIEFRKMYAEFEEKYNPYPVEMSRSEAFGKALNDGLIDQETYDEARKYYGNLWNYVGD